MNKNKFSLGMILLLFASQIYAADYKVDPAHSFVTFRLQHLGYSWTYGQFNAISGTFSYDSASPENSKISVQIDTATIDTNNAERDQAVRENWLDVAGFPKANFESTKYSGSGAEGVLEGTLILHGVSKPISIEVKKVGEGKDPWGNYRAGFIGTTIFTRADWGIPGNLGPKGEVMEFELGIEGIRM